MKYAFIVLFKARILSPSPKIQQILGWLYIARQILPFLAIILQKKKKYTVIQPGVNNLTYRQHKLTPPQQILRNMPAKESKLSLIRKQVLCYA